MELNKTMYDYLEVRMKNENLSNEDLQHFNDNVLNYLTDCFTKRKTSEVEKQLGILSRFQALLTPKIEDKKSYSIGILTGIQKTFQILLLTKHKNNNFDKAMKGLTKKANVNDVLEYLYNHPDSQHKTITGALGINKGYLTQILKELADVGCVERYATGSRSFFSLSLDGQAFVRQKDSYNKLIGRSHFDLSDNYRYKYYVNLENTNKSEMVKYHTLIRKEETTVG